MSANKRGQLNKARIEPFRAGLARGYHIHLSSADTTALRLVADPNSGAYQSELVAWSCCASIRPLIKPLWQFGWLTLPTG